MEISLTTYDPNDAADIVDAVVDAYMSEVIDVEREQRRQRVSELDRLYIDKDQEVRSKRNELKQLAEQLGTAEMETLNLKQKLTLEELAAYRQELMDSESKVARLRSKFASLQAKLNAVKNADISDLECEMFAPNDPILRNLIQEIMFRKSDKQYTSGALKTEENSNKFAEKYQSDLDRMENDYSQRIQRIRDEIRRKRQGDMEMEIKEVEAAIDIANKQQKTNEEDVQRLRRLAEQFGNSSVDVEMLRSDIKNREKSLDSIRIEREKLKVELLAPPRHPAAKKGGSSNNKIAPVLDLLIDK